MGYAMRSGHLVEGASSLSPLLWRAPRKRIFALSRHGARCCVRSFGGRGLGSFLSCVRPASR